MSNPLEQWQAVRLSKPMTVNVTVFPEANIVAKEGEKIAVKIPEGSIVYVAITNPKSGQTFVPIPAATTQAPAAAATQAPAKPAHQAGHPAQKGKKNAGTYKPKATQPNGSAPAGTNNASAATAGASGDAQQAGGQQQPRGGKGPRNNNNNRNRNNKNKAAPAEPKVITAEDLKRQREEQAKHEAWLAQRKEFERKEREEQDRRYKERLERQKKLKEEQDARKKKEQEAAGVTEEQPKEGEQQKEGEKESTGPKSCWICGSDKHIARKCSSRCKRSDCNQANGPHSIQNCKASCLLCKGKGHDEWYCEKRCPVCRRGVGEPHLLEDCPVECRLCGAKGHRDRDCEYSYGNRNRN